MDTGCSYERSTNGILQRPISLAAQEWLVLQSLWYTEQSDQSNGAATVQFCTEELSIQETTQICSDHSLEISNITALPPFIASPAAGNTSVTGLR